MSRKRHTPERIIRKLREAEVALAQGVTIDAASTKRPNLRKAALGEGESP